MRYDGKSKKQEFLLKQLSDRLQLKPICPEFISGFGVPRPPIQRVKVGDTIAVQRVEDGMDVTEQLSQAIHLYADELQQADGLILKARSPSCGIADTALHDIAGNIMGYGSGLFVEQLSQLGRQFVLSNEENLQSQEQINRFVFRASLLKESRQVKDSHAVLKHYRQYYTLTSLADWQAKLCDLSQPLS